jgi:predicted negative regulator of RcsB-dependent stress response
MQGDKSSAYEAYEQAINLSAKDDDRVAPVLQIKLNQVAPIDSKEQVSVGEDA